MKTIEEIEVGDKVLAYNEATGEQAYKPVVRLFRNETKEWHHVFAGGEEMVCTGGHPFYVVGMGFILAKNLKANEKLLLSDGKEVIIEKIEVEQLAESETTYNFEVADFHTYYVGNLGILCHNRCKLGKNMEKAGTKFKANEDAHHLYPQKFRAKFAKIGINVDDAVNGIAMNNSTHRAGAYAYNKLWEGVIDSVTSKNASQYMQKFMQIVYRM